jgi:hypothetical protein
MATSLAPVVAREVSVPAGASTCNAKRTEQNARAADTRRRCSTSHRRAAKTRSPRVAARAERPEPGAPEMRGGAMSRRYGARSTRGRLSTGPGASVPLLRRQLVDAGADGLLEVDEVLEPPGLAELSEDPPLLDEPLLSELELDDDEESLFEAAAAPESVLDEPDLLSVR